MITIDNERCIQCNECVEECHWDALRLEDEKVIFDAEKCSYCGHCMALCPRDCIVIDGDGYDCEDVEDLAFAKRPGNLEMRNLIMARRAVRYFTEEKVTEEQLKRILEAGKYAPTGLNNQDKAFIVIDSNEKRAELLADTVDAFERLMNAGKVSGSAKKLIDAFRENGADRAYYGAPMVIFVFARNDIDGAIAAATMGMQINSERLGFCIIKSPTLAFDDEEFAKKWQAPEGKKCVLGLVVGESGPEYFSSVPRLTPPLVRF